MSGLKLQRELTGQQLSATEISLLICLFSGLHASSGSSYTAICTFLTMAEQRLCDPGLNMARSSLSRHVYRSAVDVSRLLMAT